MKILSHKLSNSTPQYAGKKSSLISFHSKMSDGESCNKHAIHMDLHTGTHIDFPLHFCEEGKSLCDYNNDGIFIFNNWNIIESDIPPNGLIEFLDLSNTMLDTECLLIRTNWEKIRETDSKRYALEGPGLHAELASKLKKKLPHIKCIGFDFISLTSYRHREHGRVAHRKFLCESDILIIEDMRLSTVLGVSGALHIVPLQVKRADGTPVTAYIMDK